ncbi:alkene reductase [Rhizobium sp. P40RR-XXII]|uniref:alkene reductase n=1 Tax=unclassified Rhizobium TaxID=2613769 RepID=UPI001457398E|nr:MULTISPECIES: alkene reductase [unclassified Rhizobium]NLR88902.1 alkene reductase [Rhizobium sp. P28RR-XV]NLS20619.1 alkene reductase [Rhizobium sp. P40RR-XXII]
MAADLFSAFQLNDLTLSSRMVMAPMTRNRADGSGNVTPMMVTHYQQRATAGLIISESTPVSAEAVGYPYTPGLFADTHVTSWLRLTNAVHSSGGRIFVQLQHCGRISHPSLQPEEAVPVAPSPVRPSGRAITYAGMQDFVTPRELMLEEIPGLVAQFRHAAELAKRAGFDGIEIHGANGYLIDQFLRDGSNRRGDAYGGSVGNRMRLLNEILDAVSEVWPARRIGVRLTPENSFNAMVDSDPQAHFEYIIRELGTRGLAYVHVLQGDMSKRSSAVDYRALRSCFAGTYIANNGYDLDLAKQTIANGDADLVAFGLPFLANPDLVRRYRQGLPLNTADPATFYGGDDAGYTDYPFFTGEEASAA